MKNNLQKKTLSGFEGVEWKLVKVGDVFKLGRGRVISKKEIEKNQGIYPVYSSQTSNNGEFGKIATYDFEGDYITWTTDGANAGTVFYRTGKFNCTNVCGIAKAISIGTIDYCFCAHYLSRIASRYVSKVGNDKLMNNVFAEIPLSLPPLPEQVRIASCLSKWDEGIEILKKLIDAKKRLKKGLMQRLLSPENPLSGFESVEWRNFRLGDLGNYYNGLSGKSKEHFGKGKKFITYLNIFQNNKINLNQINLVEINGDEKQNKIQYGDIFFTISSETSHEIGMSSVLLNIINEDIYLNSFCFGFRLTDFQTLLPEFASFVLRSKQIRREIIALGQGSIRFNISKLKIMDLEIHLPPLPIQQKIAQILSKADEEIELLGKKLDNFETQKKGLMQILLSGKVRFSEFIS